MGKSCRLDCWSSVKCNALWSWTMFKMFPLPLLALLALPPQGDCQASVALVVGGWSTPNSSEVLSLEQELSCTLPPLPAEMSGHTVDVVGGKVVACLEYLCYQLVGGYWDFLSASSLPGLDTPAVSLTRDFFLLG